MSFFWRGMPLRGALLFLAPLCLASQNQPPAAELRAAAEEFKVLTRTLGLRGDSARQRNAAGRQAKFHGRVYENFRNDFLDAIPHEIVQRGGAKNLLRRNQFGFNVSGPVVIPKLYSGGRSTFFSVNYEGVRERIGRSYLRTIPIEGQRRGDYSEVVDSAGNLLQIYDPSTTRLNPDFRPELPVTPGNLQYLRDPFPGRQIPTARQDPVARAALEHYPLPNSDAGPFFRNNYFVVSPETNTANGMIFKVDHAFLEKFRVSVGYSFTNGFAGTARYIPTIADSAAPDRAFNNRRFSLEHTYTASARSVNTASFEVLSDVNANQTEGDAVPASLGLSGVPGGAFPRFDLGSFLDMGRVSQSTRNARNTYTFSDSHSLRIGRHNLRGSFQLVRYQVNSFVPQYPSGFFRFTSGLTSLPGIVNTGNSFETFLLGLSDYAEVSLVGSPSYFRAGRGVLAAQDNWEIRQGLNVSFGARVEMSTPRTEKYDRQSTVDLTKINPENGLPGALAVAKRGGAGRAFQKFTTRVEPNVSVAWNPLGNRKAVLRAGYSRSYQSVQLPGSQWGTQGFNGYSTFISPNAQLQPALVLGEDVPPPAVALPDLRPEAANNTGADLMEASTRLPVYQSCNLSYERELRWEAVVTVSAGTSWGESLFVGNGAIGINAIHPDNLSYRDELNNEAFRRTLRPYPQYQTLDVAGLWPGGKYRRYSLLLRAEKRSARGLSLNASYEFSRQWDDYSATRQDFFNPRNEWGLTLWNNPNRLSMTFMYELPIGANKPFLNFQDWRGALVNGWSISGISSLVTGEPLLIRPQFNNTGGVLSAVRINTVPGVDPEVEQQSPELWFNPAAFSHPADFALGTGPRSHPTLRGPLSQNHDLSVSKRIPIDIERAVEFNASAFNFINHANWNDPDTVIGPASAPNVNSGRIIGSRGGRVIQLGLRFSF